MIRANRALALVLTIVGVTVLGSFSAHAGCTSIGPANVGDSCSPPAPNTSTKSTASPADASGAAGHFRSLINGERSSRGIGKLSRNRRLEEIALAHAKRMAAAGRIYHNATLFYRSTLESLGNPRMIGENVGRGTSVDGLHDAFMNSAEHRENILERGYSQTGIAVIYASGSLWVVETFMSPVHTVWPGASHRAEDPSAAKSRVLGFSVPAIGAWHYADPHAQVEAPAGGSQVLGASQTIPARAAGGAAGVVVVMTLAMVLGAAIPRRRDRGEYV